MANDKDQLINDILKLNTTAMIVTKFTDQTKMVERLVWLKTNNVYNILINTDS